MASIRSSGSSGSKKPKKARNPNRPGKEYANAVREIVLLYYKVRSLEMLHQEFLDGGVDGFVSLCVDIGREITDKLEETELYNNWVDYAEHIQWLDELVSQNTTNVVMGTFEVIHKKIPGQGYNLELKDLLQKLKVVEAFRQRFLGVKNKGIPWRESILKSTFAQHLQDGAVWFPKKVKIVEMLMDRAEGGYREVQHVRIARMASIPIDCDFVAKKSKAAIPLLQRQAQCMEACVNPIQHPGIIKFWAIHHNTMESYTLWWNGGSLASFLQKLNFKVSEAIILENIKFSGGELLLDELDKVTLYQRNRTKLALLLLIIVEKCHSHGIQHNNLNPSNILLHFPPMDKTKMFLGVCDWGMACHVSEEVASNYGFRSEEEMEMQQGLRQHVAPELFYVFGPRRSETSLERQKQKHLYTKEGDAYVARKLASMIWQEEPDNEMLLASE